MKLKANHGPLLAAAQAAFTAAEAAGTLRWSSTEDNANDRIEHRCGCVFSAPAARTSSLSRRIGDATLRGKRGAMPLLSALEALK